MSLETLRQLRLGQLPPNKRLAIHCGLTEFPSEIFDQADTIEILDLSNNHLRALPDDLGRLTQLKAAFFFNNEFEDLPPVLADCPRLDILGFKANRIRQISPTALSPRIRWLILTDNQLERLPTTIGSLTRLQKLMLAGNQLRSLPDEMRACHSLELLRVAANQLPSLPTWLLTLPRLSWLAYAGNPFCRDEQKQVRSLLDINWADLTLETLLGQGASGITSKALWQVTATDTQEVAVKVFKGNITSDGVPLDEMQACIAAGSHPNLVSVLGKLVNHPEAKAGLVFSLIPADYKILGSPPSLDTCTRDTFPPDTHFSLAVILRIAQGVASAAAHLHSRGIMHGDLYAHNTLVNAQGDSLLSDFGAACFYDRTDSVTAPALERLEVRAFGCLLDDLLTHADQEDLTTYGATSDRLRQLRDDCLHPTALVRPLFTTICQLLADLA